MCFKNNKPVNEYHCPCGACPDYLITCMPIIVEGLIVGECDLCYCKYCSYYEDCPSI